MLDETFAESLAHAPAPALARARGFSGHKIIGRRLRPYTFWAAANLDFIRSPFAGHPSETGIISFADIYLATEVCRLRWPNTINVNKLDFEYRAFRYGRRIAKDIKYRVAQAKRFIDYIRDYNTVPEPVVPECASEIKLPWHLYYVAMLVKHGGFTQRQAWETPVGFGQWWVTAMLTASGHNIDIVSAEDRKQLEALNRKPTTDHTDNTDNKKSGTPHPFPSV